VLLSIPDRGSSEEIVGYRSLTTVHSGRFEFRSEEEVGRTERSVTTRTSPGRRGTTSSLPRSTYREESETVIGRVGDRFGVAMPYARTSLILTVHLGGCVCTSHESTATSTRAVPGEGVSTSGWGPSRADLVESELEEGFSVLLPAQPKSARRSMLRIPMRISGLWSRIQ